MDVLIGADPELFLEKDGKPVSAYGLIPGTKQQPFPVPYGGVQVDGMACEFNIDPVCSLHDFRFTINSVLHTLRSMVPEYNVCGSCIAEFPVEYFNAQPDEAKQLGCDADFNAYTMTCNPSPDTSKFPTMRTAAGHIHLGWTKGKGVNDPAHFSDCGCVARQLDYYLGIPSIILDNTPESKLRREMYGKAGTFRPKHYGMEYRVLSNFWIRDNKTIEWAFNQAQKGFKELISGNEMFHRYGDTAQRIIDTNNIEDAAFHVQEFLL